MRKAKWIEFVEWCALASIILFLIGVYLTNSEDDEAAGARSSFVEE
jgi:hypothetical protein